MALKPVLRNKVDELFLHWLSEPDTQQLLRQNLLQIAKGDIIPQLLPVLGVESSPRGIRTTPRICPGSPPCAPVIGKVSSPRSPRRTYLSKSVSTSTTSTHVQVSRMHLPRG
uniref:Uncharacterized protein n=1 Tax=Octopus bimaculoides TaxID=37653 RepID=A0A0L8I3T4_OCTBM